MATLCGACRQWKRTKETKPKATEANPNPEPVAVAGECRAKAPVPSLRANQNAAWPTTKADDFCGEGNPA
jgi:hypothetical protein